MNRLSFNIRSAVKASAALLLSTLAFASGYPAATAQPPVASYDGVAAGPPLLFAPGQPAVYPAAFTGMIPGTGPAGETLSPTDFNPLPNLPRTGRSAQVALRAGAGRAALRVPGP